MFLSRAFYQPRLSLYSVRTYLFTVLFVAGNLLLPQLTHLIPKGGLIFLPIYFFTLIAGYKFGTEVGLLTALLSPVINNLLFGMPPAFVLPAILIKSCLLAILAGTVAARSKKISLLHLLLVVLGYQVLGSLAEWSITQSAASAVQDFTTGIPGMLLQVLGGYLLLKKMATYE
ncbi:MAG: ECF transporter S component [Chitinophagaceae bacterium]|nr:ECF transporter S component [Chitinophagaceae bacterium]